MKRATSLAIIALVAAFQLLSSSVVLGVGGGNGERTDASSATQEQRT